MSNELIDETCDKILKLCKIIIHFDLKYHYKDKKIRGKSFNDFDNAFSFLFSKDKE